jgi:hypothetical protein
VSTSIPKDNINLAPSTVNDEFIASLRGNLRKTGAPIAGKKINQATIDSIVSKPISMTMDSDALDSEDDENNDNNSELDEENEYQTPGLSPVPPARSVGPIPAAPFKNDVPIKKYPLPPKRNQTAIAATMASNMASPLKQNLGRETSDNVNYAEGMRSPLKKSAFPPPPKRTDNTGKVTPLVHNNEMKGVKADIRNDYENGDDGSHAKPPALPARRSNNQGKINDNDDDDESAPPNLPARRVEPFKTSSSSSRSSQSTAEAESEEVEYSDEYADERSVHVRNAPKTPQHKHNSKHTHDYDDDGLYQKLGPRRHCTNNSEHQHHRHQNSRSRDGYLSSDDDYGYGRGSNFNEEKSSSSQFLSSAKTFSKESYQNAKEKSAPLTNKAKNGFGKLKSKIKGSNKNNSDYDDSDSDNDDRYRSRRSERPSRNELYQTPDRYERPERRSAAPEVSKIPERPRRQQSPECDGSEDQKSEAALYDVSIDEDRPPLPSRKTAPRPQGVPLPGLANEDVLKPPHKAKPPVPSKHKSDNLRVSTPPASRSHSHSISSSTSSYVPPPPPSRLKPTTPPSRAAVSPVWKEPKLDLELKSLWWLNEDASKLPQDLQGMNYQMSHGFVGTKEFKIYAFRLHDLATLRLKLVWKKDNHQPLDTLANEVEFFPPPTTTKKLLTEGHEKYGEHVANWCEVKEGQTVGNGECWTLAHDALEKACGKYAFVSTGLVHGACIATFTGSGTRGVIPTITIPSISDDIRRGDILQFKGCVFTYPQRTMTFGAPDHTAIVLDVKPSDDSNKDSRLKWLEIIHQNIGGVRKVRVADIDLGKMESGIIKVFRPVDATWVTDLAEVVI